MNFCNTLALQVVLKQISEGQGNVNVVTSPLSLNAVLNMVAVGSKGRTLRQLLEVLEAKSIDELNLKFSEIMALAMPEDHKASSGKGRGGGPLLSIVNGVWADLLCPFKPSFEEVVKTNYKADTQTVDFVNKAAQVVEEVNLWIEKGTKGLIKNLLLSIPSDTMIILANALYFKGAWKNAFEKSRTRDEDFHLLNEKKIKVPFMTSKTNEYHFYGSFDGFKLLKLPYRYSDDHDEDKFKDPFIVSKLNQQKFNNPVIASKTNEQHAYDPSKPNQQHVYNPFMGVKTNEQHDYIPFMASSNPNKQHYYSPFMANNQHHYSPFMTSSNPNEQHYYSPFIASNVKEQHFYNPLTATNPNEQHYYSPFGSSNDFKAHKLRGQYGDSQDEDKQKFSMYVFLPDERNGLENLLKRLNSEPLLLHQHCDKLGKVKLAKMWLPKFKFSFKFTPSDIMKELGVKLPFMSLGELTEMVDSSDSDKVFISDIIQVSCIEVNEEGTEAAAVTMSFACGCARNMPPPPPPPSFVADHPFFFMIKEEKSGVVFFSGAVLNPL